MNSICEKYAEAAVNLEKQIDEKGKVVPIGFGGAVVADLVMYARSPKVGETVLDNVVHASSKTNEIDETKFANILFEAHKNNSEIFYVDERTVSGELGKMLKEKTDELKYGLSAYYAVLFDGGNKADMRGSSETLPDEERLNWVGTKEEVEKYICKKDGAWQYNLTPEAVDKFNHVHDIKMEIDALILEEKERDVIKRPDSEL